MTSLFSQDTCRELAALARLSLDDAAAERFGEQLEQILVYLTQLRGVDVTDVPEYRPIAAAAPLRDDVASDPLPVDVVVGQAARARDGQIVVPKFKED